MSYTQVVLQPFRFSPLLIGTWLCVFGCNTGRHEVLEGKSCGVAGECAEGYQCDEPTQRCFRDGARTLTSEATRETVETPKEDTSAGGAPSDVPTGNAGGLPTLTDSGTLPAPGGSLDAGPPMPPAPSGPEPILLYDFNAEPAETIPDVSERPPRIDLQIDRIERVEWFAGQLEIQGEVTLLGQGDHAALTRAFKRTNELSIELWFTPEDLNQDGPARILALAPGVYSQNFIIGQNDDELVRRFKDGLGYDSWTASVLTREPMHVVLTRDESGAERLYVDGELEREQEDSRDFSGWDEDYLWTVANDLNGDRPWLGSFNTIAVYDEALDSDQQRILFELGPR